MKNYSILLAAVVVTLALSSCSGLSKGKALDIINNTENGVPAQFSCLILGQHWVVGEDYINLGGGSLISRKSDSDNSHHSVDMADGSNGTASIFTSGPSDGKSYSVFLNGVYFGRNSGGRKCDGCAECLEKYSKAGLIKLDILDDGSQYESGNKFVDAELTDLGRKYKLVPSDESEKREMEENNVALVELAHKVYTDVRELKTDDKTASALVEYYVEYSPFGTALGYTTDKNNIKTDVIFLDKTDDGWIMVPLSDKRYKN